MVIYAQTQYLTSSGTADGYVTVRDAANIAPGADAVLSDSDSEAISVRVETVDYQTNRLRLSRNNLFPDLTQYTPVGGANLFLPQQTTSANYTPITSSAVGNPILMQVNGTTIARLEATAPGTFTFDNYEWALRIRNDAGELNPAIAISDGHSTNFYFNTYMNDTFGGGQPAGSGDRFHFRRFGPPSGVYPVAPGFGFGMEFRAARDSAQPDFALARIHMEWIDPASASSSFRVMLSQSAGFQVSDVYNGQTFSWLSKWHPADALTDGLAPSPSGSTITGIPDPVQPYDAANRSWVLAQIAAIPPPTPATILPPAVASTAIGYNSLSALTTLSAQDLLAPIAVPSTLVGWSSNGTLTSVIPPAGSVVEAASPAAEAAAFAAGALFVIRTDLL